MGVGVGVDTTVPDTVKTSGKGDEVLKVLAGGFDVFTLAPVAKPAPRAPEKPGAGAIAPPENDHVILEQD